MKRPWRKYTRKEEGKPIGAALKYEAIGIYSEADIANPDVPKRPGTVAGDIKIRDVNGDGEINSLDQVRQDMTNIPDITYGININLSWKQFDLTLGFQGQARAVFYLREDWVKSGYIKRWCKYSTMVDGRYDDTG